MRVLRFSEEAAREAGVVARRGGVIVYPTDTLYGLGCDPLNPDVVERVERIKGRTGKPMPILASSLEQLKEICFLRGSALELAMKFWPGQLTIIAPARAAVVGRLTVGGETVGVRIPGSFQALKIIEEAGGLLVGTSANPSGESPARSVEELDIGLAEQVDLVVDGGRCPVSAPSTVVEPRESTLLVRRVGAVPLERLKPIAEELGLTLKVC